MSDQSRSGRGSGNPPTRRRLQALDLLRGTIMVLMALDHAAYFIAKRHPLEFWGSPLPVHDGWLSFLTRFVTHVCATGFFFLMGIGMVLLSDSRGRVGWSHARATRYLAIRGLLIILIGQTLEVVPWIVGDVVPHADAFVLGQVIPGDAGEVRLGLTVLFALGVSMVLCSVLIRLPSVLTALLGIVAIGATQLFVAAADPASTAFSPVMRIVMIPGKSGFLLSVYPVIPWIGLTMLGIVFAREVILSGRDLISTSAFLAGVCIAAFLVLRGLGGFGVFHEAQPGLIGFLNVVKYPPSLAFLTLTMGLNLLMLAIFGSIKDPLITRPLQLIGRTALFFYIVHLYVFLIIGLPFRSGTGYGFLYLGWVAGLVVVYPLCRLFLGFKTRKESDSVWRML